MMLTLGPMASHDQKSHVTSYFGHLDLINAMVVLMMSLVSCNTNTGTNSITWPNKIATCSDCFDLRNAVVPFMMPLVWCDIETGSSGVIWSKMSCWTSFWSSWPKECNGAIDNIITLPKMVPVVWHNQRCHVALHFDCLGIRNAIVSFTMLLM